MDTNPPDCEHVATDTGIFRLSIDSYALVHFVMHTSVRFAQISFLPVKRLSLMYVQILNCPNDSLAATNYAIYF